MTLRSVCFVAALTLAGCAHEVPKLVSQSVDPRALRFHTEECDLARQQANAFDENIGGRVGAGAAIGLLLGPLGLPLAISGDVAHAQRRQAAVAWVREACAGDLAGELADGPAQALRRELQELDERRSRERWDDDTQNRRRAELVKRYLAGAGIEPTDRLVIGRTIQVRDLEPLSKALNGEPRFLVSDVNVESVTFNGGEFSLWRRNGTPRSGRPPGIRVSGFDLRALRAGQTVAAVFHPSNPSDESVPVQLRIEGEESVSAAGGSVRAFRAQLSGYASSVGPHQMPSSWRGAAMSGPIWLDRVDGTVIRAAVHSAYPHYAAYRELVSVDPAARVSTR